MLTVRYSRSFALVSVVLSIVLTACKMPEQPAESTGISPNLITFSDNHYQARFHRDNIFTGSEETWEDFFASVDNHFDEIKDDLEADWHLSGEELRAAYYMNVVSNIFGLGDPNPPPFPAAACVDSNQYVTEEQGVQTKTNPFRVILHLTPQVYLNSPLGCCNDFSMLTYLLLKHAGIEVKQIGFPGHIYDEAVLDGKPYILDAMFNFMAGMTNEEFLNQDPTSTPDYLVFPFSMEQPSQTFLYRSTIAEKRAYHFANRGRTSTSQPRYYEMWEQYDLWIGKGYVDITDVFGEPDLADD